MASNKSIDNNTAGNLVPVFLVRNRPAPAVYCPNIGHGEFLLGTHIIYTTTVENKVCVGRFLLEVIDGNNDKNMVNVNVYNIANASSTLDICKRRIKEVEVIQAVEIINTLNIIDIAFVLHDDEFERYPNLSFINTVYRVSKYTTGQTIDNFKSFSSAYYDLDSINNVDNNSNTNNNNTTIGLRSMMLITLDFCYEIFLAIIQVLKGMHISLCVPSTDQGYESYFNVDVCINKIRFFIFLRRYKKQWMKRIHV